MTKTTDILQRSANFSRCRQYRYALWRQWAEGDDFILLIGLNPSTANHRQDDPTIRRGMGFARDWGYSGLCVANLFAFRATYPKDLFAAADPVGPKNDQWLRKLANQADLVVAAWGNLGHHMDRAHQVANRLGNLHAIRVNASGDPAHPLYLPKHLTAHPWAGYTPT
ncbi:DUF1643 domain-containing protein [Alcanivorax sp. S6407]|uniref:DUF1643 domain-containing protein n=1 Tax=Alcanivorax sp. S6407 TaxID=2926424 RepID=UPI001FF457B2|nr:DUF1643 domain-containing protein [Alcanivorax sp. S6407]MCK0152908.1 DUF1643 domain-containing protein [Alcanivorax sp. S6407]